MSDDILVAMASNVLKGFVTMGGLEPASLDKLRAVIAQAVA